MHEKGCQYVITTCGWIWVATTAHDVQCKHAVNKVFKYLTQWGRVRHIYVSKLSIIGSDNGLSPGRRQAIIWTNAGILLIGPLGTNFSEILIGIQKFSFKKTHLKMPSAKWRLFCLGFHVLMKTVGGIQSLHLSQSRSNRHWNELGGLFIRPNYPPSSPCFGNT